MIHLQATIFFKIFVSYCEYYIVQKKNLKFQNQFWSKLFLISISRDIEQ